MQRSTSLFLAAALLAAGLVAGAAPSAAPPAAGEGGEAYANCMAQARRHPEAALQLADAMDPEGTGAPARHCRANALSALGRSAEAAEILATLSRDLTNAPAAERAELAAQAGRAWLDAGNAAKAAAAFGRALTLTPDDVGLLMARAVAHGAAGKAFEALDDLNRAVEIAPDNAEARVLRAAAWRRVEAPDLAREDLAVALRLDPQSADGWLELGLLRAGRGDADGARVALQRAIRLDPGGAAGKAAHAALDRLAAASRR